MIRKLFYFLLFVCVSGVLAGAGSLYWLIVVNPGPEIEERNIESILGKESPVFYNDNTTKLGVFFDTAHRQYVTYTDIPSNFVNALVAAEDNRFFSHFGFDLGGIFRAAVKNIEARRVVQGGSTLTQQTAKNLFERTERSFKAKAKELLFALRLEYKYPKEKIFEFYANQFYVSGNGHGLGVAARYYFDKNPSELNLVECAFIAGSVKRPNYYNPFIKKTEESAELARIRARVRLRYVLDKMLELGMINSGAYNESLAAEIGFNQGKVGYAYDYTMEMVKDAVYSTEVLGELEKHGVKNVSISGIRIITTVDKEIQQKTLYALRHDLSRLDVMLRGYERKEVQEEYRLIEYNGDPRPEPDTFLFGVITEVPGKNKEIQIEVDFGRKNGSGIVDGEGLKRLAEARVKWQKNLWAEAKEKDIRSLADQFEVGDRIWVSVREIQDNGDLLLNLEKYPALQGAALVMKDGMIQAMAGGIENRFYNRAIAAKRTMGSSFKPFLYTAALQLGWSSSDKLSNKRDVFIFHNQPYFPRPDHISPHDQVSMSWAGVHSENVASVWLLAHLCDHLNPSEFREMADYLGLAPRIVDGEQEPYRTYRVRIRDRYGMVVTKDVLRAAAYNAAVRNSAADFMFEGMVDDYSYFSSLHYGRNFDDFSEQIKEELKDKKLTAKEREELRLRRKILSVNYLSLAETRKRFRRYVTVVDDPYGVARSDQLAHDGEPMELYYNPYLKVYLFLPISRAESHLHMVDKQRLQQYLYSGSDMQRQYFWQNVRLDNTVSVAAFDMLAKQIDYEYKRLQRELPYSFAVLSEIDDFRMYVGLRYLMSLGHEMGIKSKLEPVLSFPLGSNVVSLLEATRMYETMVTGKLISYGQEPLNGESDNLLILDRIESEDGQVLYKPERHEKVVLGPKSRVAVGHILENVIKFGTGRKADKALRLHGEEDQQEVNALNLPLPLLGKTGTANRYTNASFFGYLPGVAEQGTALEASGGYAVGTYVGFDDNSPMRKGSIRITGSAGALPTWIDVVDELVVKQQYAGSFDSVDLSFQGLQFVRDDAGQINLAADPEQGGALVTPLKTVPRTNRYKPSIMTFGTKNPSGGFDPERNFEPFWKVAELTD